MRKWTRRSVVMRGYSAPRMFVDAGVPVRVVGRRTDHDEQFGRRLSTWLQHPLVDWHGGDTGFTWADEFDEAARDIMLGDPDRLASLREHAGYTRAVPTPDHLLPLAYIAGVSAATGGSRVSRRK